MSILRKVFGLPERREFSLQAWENWLDGGGTYSNAGEMVNMSTALTLTAVYACTRIISETVGSLPITLFQKKRNVAGLTGLYEATEDDLYWILQQRPNDEQTPMGLLETQSAHGCLRGNSYMYTPKSKRNGRTLSLNHVDTDRVTVKRRNGILLYDVRPPLGETGITQTYTQDEICHFALFSADGVMGLSPLGFARHTFGLSLAQEKYASKLFSNGALPRGTIYQDRPEIAIDPAELEDAKNAWREAMSGVENAHKAVFLPGGLKYMPISLTPEDAQLLQSRQFQLSEIARIFRVPLHLLAELTRATFSNIEHQSLEFVIHTIRPWLVRWEQTLSRDILTDRQRKEGFVIKFNHEELLRGDTETQSNAINTYILNGVYSLNEGREKLNKNPIPGGDKHLMPLNMTTLGAQPAQPGDKQQNPAGNKKREVVYLEDYVAAAEREARERDIIQQIEVAFTDVFELSLRRLVNKESVAIKKNVRKLRPIEFQKWLENFYRDFRAEYEETATPLACSLAGASPSQRAFAEERTRELAGVYVDSSLAGMRSLIGDDDPVDWTRFVADVEALADKWKDGRAREWAERHTKEIMREKQ